jgi:hypothetical protein
MAEEDIHLCTEPMDGEYEMSENGELYSSKKKWGQVLKYKFLQATADYTSTKAKLINMRASSVSHTSDIRCNGDDCYSLNKKEIEPDNLHTRAGNQQYKQKGRVIP